jgi:hypothetical protein
MRHRTAVKTGRTAAQQSAALPTRAFTDYAAMVDRLSSTYTRPLFRRISSPRHLS